MKNTSVSLAVAPATDVLEVSVFGPGRGECLLIHLGAGDWMMVDSCRNQKDGSHPALNYLEQIGVDVGTRLVLLVATHAHDDHTAGISTVYNHAKAATFVCAPVATANEFLALVEADAEVEAQLGIRVRNEYREVLEEVRSRGAAGAQPILHATPGRTLWPNPGSVASVAATVTALSPSDYGVLLAKTHLANALGKPGERRRLSSQDPNEFSIGLHVSLGGHHALLGADLLPGPAGTGWDGILTFWTPPAPASLYKVSHHGSDTGDHAGVWSNLVGAQPLALVAPFRAGKTRLPKPTDVARIKALAGDVYLTADPNDPAASRNTRKTASRLQAVATNVRDAYGVPGHVRARADPSSGEWSVETFGPARQL